MRQVKKSLALVAEGKRWKSRGPYRAPIPENQHHGRRSMSPKKGADAPRGESRICFGEDGACGKMETRSSELVKKKLMRARIHA